MNNTFGVKNSIILILTIIIIGLVFYNSKDKSLKSEAGFLGIENNITELNKDIEFYKYLTIYRSPLSDEKFKIVDDRMTKVSDEMNKDDSKIQKVNCNPKLISVPNKAPNITSAM